MNRHHIKGKVAESVSVFLLILKGYRPLSMNDVSGGVEADIIACKGDEIALVEVKWRKTKTKAHYAIHPNQKVRLQRKARMLHKKYPHKIINIHLMLICPTPPFIEHIKNPF